MRSEDKMMKRLLTVPWTRSPRPFVKWAGGKGQLLQQLEQCLPSSFSTYHEPFLGGGAFFFHLVEHRPRFSAILSDINSELINAYDIVKNRLEELIEELLRHEAEYGLAPKQYYYQVRAEQPSDDVGKAARLIFLNRTCYNGLYRVNRMGKFNVPFGRYKNPTICDKENLLAVSQVLLWSKAKLLAADYKEATKGAEKGDLVYFDPPYQPVSATANFTSYTNSGFSFDDQIQLGDWFRELDKRGCRVLLSNSSKEEVRRIYCGYSVHEVKVLRAISCKTDRRKGHTEFIVGNYDGGPGAI